MKKGNHFQLIYILPNLFTAASIFAAVLSMSASLQHRFVEGAWYVFLSLLFDGLDGRIARLTHATSRFGVEFDSLADLVAFGVAPSLLLYLYVGQDYGRFGLLVMALFIIFGAIRLARFNVMSPNTDPSVFVGLPIPAAAAFVVVWVLLFLRYDGLGSMRWLLLVVSLVVAFLMVSNLRYPSFKRFVFSRVALTKILVWLIVVASLLYLFPVEGLGLLLTLYIGWGIVRALHRAGKIIGK